MLKPILFVGALAVAGGFQVGLAAADEMIIHRDAPVVEEAAPTTSRTTVEKHGPDCDSKSVHTENAAGDSKTVTQQDCD